MIRRVLGKDLKVGDVIEVWFAPHRNRIETLTPINGPYADNILKGARIATFLLGNLAMTIEANSLFTVHGDLFA